jgi:hypothetical protein
MARRRRDRSRLVFMEAFDFRRAAACPDDSGGPPRVPTIPVVSLQIVPWRRKRSRVDASSRVDALQLEAARFEDATIVVALVSSTSDHSFVGRSSCVPLGRRLRHTPPPGEATRAAADDESDFETIGPLVVEEEDVHPDSHPRLSSSDLLLEAERVTADVARALESHASQCSNAPGPSLSPPAKSAVVQGLSQGARRSNSSEDQLVEGSNLTSLGKRHRHTAPPAESSAVPPQVALANAELARRRAELASLSQALAADVSDMPGVYTVTDTVIRSKASKIPRFSFPKTSSTHTDGRLSELSELRQRNSLLPRQEQQQQEELAGYYEQARPKWAKASSVPRWNNKQAYNDRLDLLKQCSSAPTSAAPISAANLMQPPVQQLTSAASSSAPASDGEPSTAVISSDGHQ